MDDRRVEYEELLLVRETSYQQQVRRVRAALRDALAAEAYWRRRCAEAEGRVSE